MTPNNANKKLFDLLISKNFDPQALNNQGKPAPSPDQATLFSFDYKGQSGQDYGTVVLQLGDDLDVYCGDNIGKAMEDQKDRTEWFDDFLYQLKNWSVRNVPGTFNLMNLNKLKYSMQGQAAIKEGLFESWQGTKNTSWNGDSTQARLMIKHKKNLGENDKRFRYIESLFIETQDGERFKLPFLKLSAGRAMLEHVKQGGKPYDIRGQHIVTVVSEMNLLSRFRRANQGKIFEGETQQLVEQATHYYETLQNNLKSLGTSRGYAKYFESWDPAALTDEDVIIEDLRHMFIEQNIDSRIEQALPLLAKLQKENAMKEANIFEDWANLITEGTWEIPDTKEKQNDLVKLLSKELPVGADATNATEQLYNLLGDDELFDRLEELAEENADADGRKIILARLEELKSNPDIAEVIGKIKTSPTPPPEDFWNSPTDDSSIEDPNATAQPPADATAQLPADATAQPQPPAQPPVAENEMGEDKFEMESIRKLAGVAVLKESGMSEVDILLQDIARGDVDIYNVYANPKTNVEKFVSDQIHEKVDNLMIDAGYHKDDIEEMLQIIHDELSKDYDTEQTDETDMGKTIGSTAGEIIGGMAGSRMGQPVAGAAAGSAIGGHIGDKISDMMSDDDEDESLSESNYELHRIKQIAGIGKDAMYETEQNVRTQPKTSNLSGYNTAYLEKVASGAPGNWKCTPAEAKAELATRVGSKDPHTEAPSQWPIPTNEGPIGQHLGKLAGEFIAGGPEDPLAPHFAKIGAHYGEKLGTKISDHFLNNILPKLQDKIKNKLVKKNQPTEEGIIGKSLGAAAGELMALGPENPLSFITAPAGAYIGDKIGDKVSDMFSRSSDDGDMQDEMEESSHERTFPDPAKPYIENGRVTGIMGPNGEKRLMSKSHVVGADGMIYHWQDPRQHNSKKTDEAQSPFPSRNDPALAAQAAATQPGHQSVMPSRNEPTKENSGDNSLEESGEKDYAYHRAKERHHEKEGDKAMARADSFGAYAHPQGISARTKAEQHYAKADEHRAAWKELGSNPVEKVAEGEMKEESGDRTPLAGQYGHSGKLQTVDGIDQDMMDRIKFLAGIKENETVDGQENSELTKMKSLSSIFLR